MQIIMVNKDNFTPNLMGTCFCLNYQPPVKSSVWFFCKSWEKYPFHPKAECLWSLTTVARPLWPIPLHLLHGPCPAYSEPLSTKQKHQHYLNHLDHSLILYITAIITIPSNHQNTLYVFSTKNISHKLSLLTKQVVVRAQHPWVSGCQKLSTNSLYHLLHIKTSLCLFFVLFWYIFFAIDSAWIQKIASVKSVIFFWIQYQLYSVGVIIFKDFASNTQSAALVLSGRRRLGAILSLRGLRRVTLSPSVGPRGPLWEELLLFVIKLEMEKWNKKGPREALLFFFKLELKKWSKT